MIAGKILEVVPGESGEKVYKVKLSTGLEKSMDEETLARLLKSEWIGIPGLKVTSDNKIITEASEIKLVDNIGEPMSADKCIGAFMGAIIGDAIGVPYEFFIAEEVPSYDLIGTTVPEGCNRTYPGIPVGTWSDDSSNILCLSKVLLEHKAVNGKALMMELRAWYRDGRWAVNNHVFDIGDQTKEAIKEAEMGTPANQCGLVRPNGKGNGGLMRTLPVAIYFRGNRSEIVKAAHSQCIVTHGHPENGVCCALYSLMVNEALSGANKEDVINNSLKFLRAFYKKFPRYLAILDEINISTKSTGEGSGYVTDALKSVIMVFMRGESYLDTVKKAIILGNDTDTTACIAGGLAGAYYGFGNIPNEFKESWLKEYIPAAGMATQLYEAVK